MFYKHLLYVFYVNLGGFYELGSLNLSCPIFFFFFFF